MTTSNSTLFELDTLQIIESALRKIGALAKGQSADTEDIINGKQALNVVWGRLITMGMPLWVRRTYTFPVIATIAQYNIGVGQTLNTPFPLKILQATLVDTTSDSSIEMEIKALYEYYRFTPAVTSGQPIQLYYTPRVNYGEILLWPTPDTSAAAYKQVRIVYQAPFEDFVSNTDTPNFPKEWYQAVIYQLAVALAPEYGVPLDDRRTLMQEAKMYTDEANSFGMDETSIYIQPFNRG